MTNNMGGNFFSFNEVNLNYLKFQLSNINSIFWDSGFFIKLLDNRDSNDKARACKALFKMLCDDSLEICNFTCDFVIEEVINYIISRYYQSKIINDDNYKSWTSLYKKNPELIQDIIPLINPLFKLLDTVPVYIYRPEKKERIDSEAFKLIREYNLCSMDAFILSTMFDAEIEDMITMDVKDMKRLQEDKLINIYSCYR